MTAIVEHGADPTEHAIHRPRYARGYRFETIGEIPSAPCLHDQMRVVALDRVVDEAESAALAAGAEAALELRDESARAQRWNVATHAEGLVRGMSGSEGSTSSMRVAPQRSWLAARAFTTSAPMRRAAKIERELLRPLCHARQG